MITKRQRSVHSLASLNQIKRQKLNIFLGRLKLNIPYDVVCQHCSNPCNTLSPQIPLSLDSHCNPNSAHAYIIITHTKKYTLRRNISKTNLSYFKKNGKICFYYFFNNNNISYIMNKGGNNIKGLWIGSIIPWTGLFIFKPSPRPHYFCWSFLLNRSNSDLKNSLLDY